ncbi:MAG TPA: hypothetical protein VKQ29_09940 [Aliidongia sp.]|nr:hypothetical protein [Aliidongia sp.]
MTHEVVAGIRRLKNDRDRSISLGMMGKLIRVIFVILIGMALVGAPLVQAAVAMPCGPTPAGMADQSPADHSQAPTPCKEKMSGCAQMLGCGVSAGLEAPAIVATNEQAWTPAVYWPVASLLEGLHLKPDLGPPIVI